MRIKADDLHVSCQLTGPGDAPVVCLSHSLACSGLMWEPQMGVLNDRFRVLRYDIRGHGGTDAPPGPYSMDRLGDDAVAMLDVLGIKRVHWVGLSMGGMIAQNLALRYPDRLLSLALCDTLSAVPEDAQAVWQERIDTAEREGMGPLCEPTLGRWFTADFLKKNSPVVEAIRTQILQTPVTGYIGCCEAIRRIDYLDQLEGVRLPTAIIVGAEDPATPPSVSEAIHERIRGSTLTLIDGAAHLTNVEQPQAFSSALLKFLEAQ